jgi:hypothetical protein
MAPLRRYFDSQRAMHLLEQTDLLAALAQCLMQKLPQFLAANAADDTDIMATTLTARSRRMTFPSLLD